MSDVIVYLGVTYAELCLALPLRLKHYELEVLQVDVGKLLPQAFLVVADEREAEVEHLDLEGLRLKLFNVRDVFLNL